MSNDPKDAVVDLSLLLKAQTPTPPPDPIIPMSNMITTCNEGANMIGHELSTLNEQMIGRENFTLNDSEKKKKPD